LADRNAAEKHVGRARIALLTADGLGTNEIMRQTGKSRTSSGAGRNGSWRKSSYLGLNLGIIHTTCRTPNFHIGGTTVGHLGRDPGTFSTQEGQRRRPRGKIVLRMAE